MKKQSAGYINIGGGEGEPPLTHSEGLLPRPTRPTQTLGKSVRKTISSQMKIDDTLLTILKKLPA